MLRRLKPWLTLAVLLGTMAYAIAEDITLTTYYPSPRGVYQELRAMGNLGVGIMAPANRLHVYSTTPTDGVAIDGTTNPGLNLRNAGTIKGSLGLATAAAGWTPNAAANDVVIRTDDAASGNLLFATQAGVLEAMRITRAGNVGIGTINPTALLHIQGNNATDSTNLLRLSNVNNDAAAIFFHAQNRDWAIGASNPASFAGDRRFVIFDATDGAARMVIDKDGNVGIGTITPNIWNFGQGVEICGVSAAVALTSTAGDGKRFLIGSTTGPVGLYFRDETAGQYRLMIDNAGNVGIGTTNPRTMLEINGNMKLGSPADGAVAACGGAIAGTIRYNSNVNPDHFEGCTVSQGWVTLGQFN